MDEISAFAIYGKQQPTKNNSRKKRKHKNKKLLNGDLHEQKKGKNLADLDKKDSVKIKSQKKIKNEFKKKKFKKMLKRKENKKIKINDIKDIEILKSDNNSETINKIAKKMKPHKPVNHKGNGIQNVGLVSCSHHPSLSSIEQGQEVFAWMIHPYSVNDFFNLAWEKQPLYVERNDPDYYKKLLSTTVIDEVLRKEFISFTKNIDITSYENGKRETHNPEGRALPHVVWDYYSNGCSVRFLNPQTYIREVHLLNTTLQDYFSCFVGANVYLTPPNSQGFAPHYDDIEAFVLQVEGKKLWKIYKPISDENELPRFSSKNFTEEEIGDPIMTVEVKAGDMLYFPRGYIHQAITIDGKHSLHITVSTYQKHSWGDLLQSMIPKALEVAFSNDIEFRKGVPLDVSSNLGLVHFDSKSSRRKELLEHTKNLFKKMCDYLPIDYGADQLCKKFISEALPPILQEREKQTTVFGNSNILTENGEVKNQTQVKLTTKVRILRANMIRLLEENGSLRVYYTIENSKEYHGNETQWIEISEAQAIVVADLIRKYPEFTAVKDIEIDDGTDKIQFVTDLWEKGLLACEEPLEYIN